MQFIWRCKFTQPPPQIRLREGRIPACRFHVTLGMLRLETATQRETARAVLEGLRARLAKLPRQALNLLRVVVALAVITTGG